MIKGGQTYYYHADALVSIIAITNSAGQVVQRYEYDSFGNITYQQDPNFKQPYTYTGREYDEESGLYYYRARYYDAKAGRFITQDPIGFAGGDVNFYAYVENSPVNFIDPSGLAKRKSEGWWEDCNAVEMAQCIADCAPRGVKSCKVWIRIYNSIRDGKPTIVTKRADKPSCNCEDPDDCPTGGPPSPSPSPDPKKWWWLLLIPILTPWPDPI